MFAQSPTDALPGSRKKIEVLCARAEANADLFVEGDVVRFPQLSGGRDFDAFVDYCRGLADLHQRTVGDDDPMPRQHRLRNRPLAVVYGREDSARINKGGRPNAAPVPDHID